MKKGKRNFNKLGTVILIFLVAITSSCKDEESISPPLSIDLTSVSGNVINMNGIWTSGCVLANNNMILNESLAFEEESLVIEINGYDDMSCTGTMIFNETITITYSSPGTTTVHLNGTEVNANKIDGTASYLDGRVEFFKQLFYVDDRADDTFMFHALFGNDGGKVDVEGYPIELIPIAITKTN